MSNANLDYYANLLILQYRGKPKASDTVRLWANQSYADGLPFQLAACFDVDTAVGPQLDIIGRIVGVPRNIYTIDFEHVFFNFQRYDSVPATIYGFGRYDDVPYDPDAALFFQYNFQGAATYTLLDPEMRLLIQLKIILNNSYSSFKQIKDLLYQYFPTGIEVIDNLNMTLTYNISSSLSKVGQGAVTLGLLPKPMGVTAIVNYV